MFENTLSGRARAVAAFSLLLVAMLLATAANADAARITPKNGTYYQPAAKVSAQFGYVSTSRAKVVNAGGNFRFRDNKGKSCVPEGLYASGGMTSVSFLAKRKAGLDRHNRFVIRVRQSPSYPKLTGSVSGAFRSSNRATISFRLSSGTCKASGRFTKALYTAGG